MTPTRSQHERYDRAVWWGGLAVLTGTFGIGLALAVLLPAQALAAAWALPLILLAPAAWAIVPKQTGTPLLLLLVLFAFVSGNGEGRSLPEIAFAMCHGSYLAWWFLSRALIYQRPFLRTWTDVFLMAFVVLIPLSVGISVLYGAQLSAVFAECLPLSVLGLYFPFRELIEEREDGLEVCIVVILLFGVVGALRVLWTLRASMADAEYAWEVAQGRVPMNEMLLYSASLLSLCLATISRPKTLSTSRSRVITTLLIVAFAVFTIGMIMTQWRAYYIAWGLAIGLLLLWSAGPMRLRVVTYIGLGSLFAVGAAILLLGDTVVLTAIGILERILSIGTAGSQDISLLNRFLEYKALWPVILESPLLGHGPGVTFSFYDAIYHATWSKTFAHNTYLLLWFKFGILGLGLFVSVWALTFRAALRARRAAEPLRRAVALFVAVALAGLTVSSIVSVTLVTDDTALCFALLFALGASMQSHPAAAGVRARETTVATAVE